MPLVVAAHVPIVFGSGLAVGGAAMVVAAETTVPFAHLWEMRRRTIWAPALLHTTIDTFKLVVFRRGDRHVLAGARGRQRDRPVPGPGRATHCPLAEQGPR